MLTLGGFDAHIASMTRIFNEEGYDVVVAHSEKSRFTMGSETKADQLRLSGLSCFWDTLDSAQMVSKALKIEKHAIYAVSRGSSVAQYGLMMGMEKFFPKLHFKGVIMTDLLPMIQLKDSEMFKEPKPYQQVFFGGKKDPLNKPENLHCYVKRLKNIAPHFSLFHQFPIHKQMEDAGHYCTTLTPCKKVFTSYSSRSFVLADALDDFNGEQHFAFIDDLITKKENSFFVEALRARNLEVLTSIFDSSEKADLILKITQDFPEAPESIFAEPHRMNLVFSILMNKLKGFIMIGSGEYQGDDRHIVEPWSVLPNYFIGKTASLPRVEVELKIDHSLRNAHINDTLFMLERWFSPYKSLRQSAG